MNPVPPVLSVDDLSVHYKRGGGFLSGLLRGGSNSVDTVKAVDGVSLELRPGETLGLVGESGCGKSSLGKAIIRLIQPSGGSITLAGEDFLSLRGESLRARRPDIQMVFQDPYASLDPRMTILEALSEPLRAHRNLGGPKIESKIRDMLSLVGMPTSVLHRYPHEFSGGQRQRIAIARALILGPKILIADEPVSSLDVSVQAQILNLLKDIQAHMNLAILFISHNLAVVRYISHHIAVMYLGRVVETGESATIYRNPLHPYTQALMSAVPVPDPRVQRSRARIVLSGEIPSQLHPPEGCLFHTRCPYAVETCRKQSPALNAFGINGSRVRCPEVERIQKSH